MDMMTTLSEKRKTGSKVVAAPSDYFFFSSFYFPFGGQVGGRQKLGSGGRYTEYLPFAADARLFFLLAWPGKQVRA